MGSVELLSVSIFPLWKKAVAALSTLKAQISNWFAADKRIKGGGGRARSLVSDMERVENTNLGPNLTPEFWG